MVVYVASRSPLPLIAWRQEAPAFNVTELTEHEQPVRRFFTLPHVRQAGSHTSCGCGFNEGREHPQVYDDAAAACVDALKSASQLASYVREHQIEQIYSCWSGDEAEPRESERHIAPDSLVAHDFFFRERELLTFKHEQA